ncbi:glutamate racemase [Pleomorphomonas sp. NRK KF1]|uniref:glutamate racemase n=1 Tax=Pleomorphomonas sp. NRK KF1 TaxID=2943000 RepID=UPI00204381AD|nr:glutamate racemase [Pleomorphomonas sp. NRK KF1]MCM5555679.1 glutamate racemase [Pleomorphomonas sp. NRK KF1]
MRILVFDSGVGGLSVAREIGKALPAAGMDYVADLAVFPYGALEPDVLIDRVVSLMDEALSVLDPAALVIACNTASTLVLPPLRARFKLPIVGTVPAVKPAAEHSHTRMASVLATPGTVKREYTHDLIETFGGDCRFTLVGSERLAGLVERQFSGEQVTDAELLTEIAPCFIEDAGKRTDAVVLACTHYPLLLDRLKALAPWPVEWIDPAPAIARRVATVTEGAAPSRGEGAPHRFFSTGRWPAHAMLEAFGFVEGEAFFRDGQPKSAIDGAKAGKTALSI